MVSRLSTCVLIHQHYNTYLPSGIFQTTSGYEIVARDVSTFKPSCYFLSSGMTTRQQQDVVTHFKNGKSRLLIATSVAEEGLDIKACNCVFRYNYSTNEIGRVQAKGMSSSTEIHLHSGKDVWYH